MKNILFSSLALLATMLLAKPTQAQTPAKNKAAVLSALKDLNEHRSTVTLEANLPPLPDPLPYWPQKRSNISVGYAQYFAAIPDAQFIVEGISASDNTVILDIVCTGTFKNKFLDWDATGKPFSFRSTETLTFDNKGKLIAGWPLPDPALYLR